MKCRSVVLLATSLLAMAHAVSAQESGAALPAPAPRLTLRDAVSAAVAGHPAIAAARARVEAAREGPAMASSLMPPMADAQIWQWPVTTINPANVNMYMFMLEQELPGRGKRALRVTAAQREVAVMTADERARERTVVVGVKQAYAALRGAQRTLAAARAVAPVLDHLTRTANASYAAGRLAQAMVVRAGIAETELAERLVMLETDVVMRKAALNGAIGRDPATPIGELDDEPPPTSVPPLESLLTQAVESHPELAMSRAAIDQADAMVAVAASERKPDWVLQGGYMLMPGEWGAVTARVGITWPTAPWAKKRLSALNAEAAARASGARADLAVARQDVNRMVAEARATLSGTLSRLAVLQNTMRPQAAHLLEASRIGFASGLVAFTEVLDAQKMQLDTETDIARLEGEADEQWAALEAAIGSDIPRPAAAPSIAELRAQEK
jgi:cobalt-zinc-cadmium efflux system outer membrane protein